MKPSILLPHNAVGCVFQLEKFNAEGITYRGPKFHNMVLDCGLDMLESHSLDELIWCNIGTGAGMEYEYETGLSNWELATNNVIQSDEGYHSGVDQPYSAYRNYRKVFEFGIGSMEDSQTISEIGLSLSENSDYFNRHRVVDPIGVYVGLVVLPDEGIRIWSDLYIFASIDSGEELRAAFSYYDGTTYVDMPYTYKLLSGWLETSNYRPGRVVKEDVRIVKSPSNNYNVGTPADGLIEVIGRTGFRRVRAEWDPGTLDGEYNGVVVQCSDSSYSRIDFDSPIVMDKVAEHKTGLVLNVDRSWGRTIEKGIWI